MLSLLVAWDSSILLSSIVAIGPRDWLMISRQALDSWCLLEINILSGNIIYWLLLLNFLKPERGYSFSETPEQWEKRRRSNLLSWLGFEFKKTSLICLEKLLTAFIMFFILINSTKNGDRLWKHFFKMELIIKMFIVVLFLCVYIVNSLLPSIDVSFAFLENSLFMFINCQHP